MPSAATASSRLLEGKQETHSTPSSFRMRATACSVSIPGRLFVWVKRLSWVELAVFAGLIVIWLLPGFETETMLFGWAHGLGFVVLCVVIWIAAVRREAPYTLLAATLTPVGPLGSVIAITWLERRQPRNA